MKPAHLAEKSLGCHSTIEYDDAAEVVPVWPAVLLSLPFGLIGGAYKLWIGGSFFGALLYYSFFGSLAFAVLLLVIIVIFPRLSHSWARFYFVSRRSVNSHRKRVGINADVKNIAKGLEVNRTLFEGSSKNIDGIPLTIVALLGGYAVSTLTFFIFSPINWVIVCLVFVPGVILTVVLVKVLKILLGNR